MNEKKRERTKKLFKDELMDLCMKKEFIDITVKELCENVGLNRSTFYLYYTDINELLRDISSEMRSVIGEIARGFSSFRVPSSEAEVSRDLVYTKQSMLEAVKYSRYLIPLLENRAGRSFSVWYEKETYNTFVDSLKQEHIEITPAIEFSMTYCCHGITGIFLKYLKEPDTDVEIVARTANRFAYLCLYNASERDILDILK